jgi:hypothetical protein
MFYHSSPVHLLAAADSARGYTCVYVVMLKACHQCRHDEGIDQLSLPLFALKGSENLEQIVPLGLSALDIVRQLCTSPKPQVPVI